jgi:hypothetical protein
MLFSFVSNDCLLLATATNPSKQITRRAEMGSVPGVWIQIVISKQIKPV